MHKTMPLLLIAVVTTLLGAAPASAERDEGQSLPTTATLDVPRVEIPMNTFGGRPLVPVVINGSGPYDFILDTGSSITLIDQALAKELKLPDLGTSEIGSPLGGTVPTMITRFDLLDVSGAAIEASPGEAMDLGGFFGTDGAPRGVLSAAHFAGLLLTFDYPGERIVLHQGVLPEPDGREVLGYEAKEGQLWIPITVAGEKMQAHLDTGSPSLLMLPLERAKDVPLEGEPVVSGHARLIGREMEIRSATLDGSLQVGSRTFNHPRVTLLEGAPAANVGREAIESFAVTLDQANRRIALVESSTEPIEGVTHGGPRVVKRSGNAEPSNAGDGPTRAVKRGDPGHKRYGIQVAGIGGDVLEVMGVESGSPADRAGLLAGDRIVSINGAPTGSLSIDERVAALRASALRVVIERQGEKLELAMTLD